MSSINDYFKVPSESTNKGATPQQDTSVSNFFIVPKEKAPTIPDKKSEALIETPVKQQISNEIINLDQPVLEEKQQVLSQGHPDDRKEDNLFTRVGRAILPNFLEKELGIDETQRTTTLTKGEMVKEQGMLANQYLMEKHPEEIAPTEYLRRGISFGNELDPTDYLRGYKSDVSVEDLPEPVTAKQKIAEGVGQLLTMSLAQPLIEGAVAGLVGKIPAGASAMSKLKTLTELKPWTVGYATNVLKAGAEGGLFGLITNNRKSMAENVLETGGSFAAFTALAFPIQQFFKPVLQAVGKMEINNPRLKNILNDPAIKSPTVEKVIWFKNPNDETQLLKVTGQGMEFVSNKNELVQAGINIKDVPTLTNVEIEAFKVKPSVYENLKGWIGGKKTGKVDFTVKDVTPETKLNVAESPETTKALQNIGNLKPSEIRTNLSKFENDLDIARSGISTAMSEDDLITNINASRDVVNDYNQANKETILEVPRKNNVNPLVNLEVVKYDDGKYLVSTDANISNSGFGSPFSGEYGSKAEAVKAGVDEIKQWIDQNKTNASPAEMAELKQIETAIKNIQIDIPEVKTPTNDKADIQQLRNSILEGQTLLRAGSIDGVKLTPEKRAMIARSIESAQAKIGVEVKDGYKIQEISSDSIFNNKIAPSAKDLTKDGLRNWNLLVKRGKAKIVDGRYYDIPSSEIDSNQDNFWLKKRQEDLSKFEKQLEEQKKSKSVFTSKTEKEIKWIKKEISNYQSKIETKKETSKGSNSYGFNPKNLENLSGEMATKETNKIIKRSEIAKKLSDKFGVPIRRGKFRHAGAIGLFKGREKVIRLKKGGMGTLFHELGHFLDGEFDLSSEISMSERKALMTEYGYTYEGDAKKQRHEAFAEFLRYKMTGQDEKIEKFAPNFIKTFDKKMADLPEVKDVLDDAIANYKMWLEQPSVAKVLSHISLDNKNTDSMMDRLSNNLHSLYTMGVEDIHPLGEFSKLAKKNLGDIPSLKDPYILARNLRGWVGKANTFLEKGTFGKKYWSLEEGKAVAKFKGKSFNEILKPLEEAKKLNDFRVYLVSKRTQELAGRDIMTGITIEDANKAVTDLEKANPNFKEVAKEIYTYQDHLLEYAKENGLMGEEGFDKIKEFNKFRVPFYRVMETEKSKFMGSKKLAGNISSPVKKIKGSEREIIDPLESIIKDTYAIINASERNNIGVALANLSSQNFELGRLFEEVAKPMKGVAVNVKEVLQQAFPDIATMIPDEVGEKMVTLFRPMQDMGNNMMTINFGDVSKVYQVDSDLFNALQGMNAEDMAFFIKVLSMPAKLLRAGATLSPDFIVRNPFRDQFSAYVFSKYGYKPFFDMVRGFFETYKKGNTYDLWRMAGGESSMMVSIDRTSMQKNLKTLLQSKGAQALAYVKNPIELLRTLSEFGEKATRLGEMKRALDAGANPLEGAYASREVTLDFARIGAKTKAVNSIIAFWNANVQDTDKIIRSFKEKPAKTLFRIMMAITIPSILLYYANRKDPRWKEIPQWQKDTFWIVMSDNHIWRIPKPFLLGQIFGSIPERTLEYMDEQDPEMFKELEKSLASGAVPSFLPTSMIPIIENITNYSFFKDRPIVSRGKENLPPKYQSTNYTSEVAKILGDKLNYSPDKIDNLISGYTGGLGNYANQIINKVLRKTGAVEDVIMPDKSLEDYPVIKAFMVRPPEGSGSESVNKLYNLYEKTQSQNAYYKKMIEKGESQKDIEAYLKENPEVVYFKYVNKVVATFSKINKAKTQIYADKTMTSFTKKAKIKELDNLESTIAKEALQATK